MSMTKRLLAMLLTVVMVATLAPAVSFAATTEIKIGQFGTGWENWGGGTYGNTTELLVTIHDQSDQEIPAIFDYFYEVENEEGKKVKVCDADFQLIFTDSADGTTKTIHLAPSTKYGTWFFRFEPTEGSGDNFFMPVKGHSYNLDLTITGNDGKVYHGNSDGYSCDMEPLTHTIPWMDRFGTGWENWVNGTYNPSTELLVTINTPATNTAAVEAVNGLYWETKDEGTGAVIDSGFNGTFTLVIFNNDTPDQKTTLTIAPSTKLLLAENKLLLRFELCDNEDFIPEIGAVYTAGLTVKDTTDTVIFSGSFGNYECDCIPYVKGEPTIDPATMYPQTLKGGLYFPADKSSFEPWGDTQKSHLIAILEQFKYGDYNKYNDHRADYPMDMTITGNDGSVVTLTDVYGISGQDWGDKGVLVRFPLVDYGFEPADGVKYTIDGVMYHNDVVKNEETGEDEVVKSAPLYTFQIKNVHNGKTASPTGSLVTLNSAPTFDVDTKTIHFDFYDDLVYGVEPGDKWRVIIDGTPLLLEVVPEDDDGYMAAFTFPDGIRFDIGESYAISVDATTGQYAGLAYAFANVLIPGTPEVKELSLDKYGTGFENWTTGESAYGIVTQALICIKGVEDDVTDGDTLYAKRKDYVWELTFEGDDGSYAKVNCTPFSYYGGGLSINRFAIMDDGETLELSNCMAVEGLEGTFVPRMYTSYSVSLNIYKNGMLRYTGSLPEGDTLFCGMVPLLKGAPIYEAPKIFPVEFETEAYTNEFTSDFEKYNGSQVLLVNVGSKYLSYSEISKAGYTCDAELIDGSGNSYLFSSVLTQDNFYDLGSADGKFWALLRIPTETDINGTAFTPNPDETYELTFVLYPADDAEYNADNPCYSGSLSGVGALTILKHEITWIVDGVEYKTFVDDGEMPVFDGTPTKAADDTYRYEFDGWDKPVVYAEADATYTAVFKQIKKADLAGDIDGNGSVAIGDVTALLIYISTEDPTGLVVEALDVNDDNVVSIGDVTELLIMIANQT